MVTIKWEGKAWENLGERSERVSQMNLENPGKRLNRRRAQAQIWGETRKKPESLCFPRAHTFYPLFC